MAYSYKEKEKTIRGKLTVTSSGGGFLSFIFGDPYTGKALGAKVTKRDVESYLKDHPEYNKYKLFLLDGRFVLYLPCTRVASDEVEIAQGVFRYKLLANDKIKVIDSMDDSEVKNEDIKSTILFFVKHEALL